MFDLTFFSFPFYEVFFVVTFALLAGALLFLLYYRVGYKVAKLIFRKESSKK